MKKFFSIAVAGFMTLSVAASEQQREIFEKWHIGIGAAFNSKVRSCLAPRNLPMPSGFRVTAESVSEADALAKAEARQYDGGGFIATDSLNNGFDTENWKLPSSSYQPGTGHFVMDNAYQEVSAPSVSSAHFDDSDRPWQFGVSVELARELWIHEEKEEHRWGVDFAAAFSYFFARDIYRDSCLVTRRETVREGVIRTDITDTDAMFDYDAGWDSPGDDDMFGYGNYNRTMINPALGFSGIGTPYSVPGSSNPFTSSSNYFASGDYQELEMLFMLRPWYEIKDWWRVFAEVGVGVSWGRFDTSVCGAGRVFAEDFDQWDCYGVAGLGTTFRYKSYTLTFDALGRFLRDDFEVHGRYIDGCLRRSDWGFRLMIGYEF